MTAVAAGDRQAFAVLFKHFAPRVTAYLVRAGSAPAQAEELAQEALVTLWHKAASFDPARGGVSTWVFTVARNLRVDRHRRDGAALDGNGSRAPELDDHDPADPGPPPDEWLGARQREERIRTALRRLSPEQASILQLSYFADQPHSAIARELQLPLGTVKSRIRLAVGNLRRLLDTIDP